VEQEWFILIAAVCSILIVILLLWLFTSPSEMEEADTIGHVGERMVTLEATRNRVGVRGNVAQARDQVIEMLRRAINRRNQRGGGPLGFWRRSDRPDIEVRAPAGTRIVINGTEQQQDGGDTDQQPGQSDQ